MILILIFIFIEINMLSNCNCRRSMLPTLMCTNSTTIELLRTTSVSCFSPRPSGETKTEALSKTIFCQLFSFSERLDQLVAPVAVPQQDEVSYPTFGLANCKTWSF